MYEDASLNENQGENSDIHLAACAERAVSGITPNIVNWIILAAAFVVGFTILVVFRKKRSDHS